jgi:hypothetical protein
VFDETLGLYDLTYSATTILNVETAKSNVIDLTIDVPNECLIPDVDASNILNFDSSILFEASLDFDLLNNLLDIIPIEPLIEPQNLLINTPIILQSETEPETLPLFHTLESLESLNVSNEEIDDVFDYLTEINFSL